MRRTLTGRFGCWTVALTLGAFLLICGPTLDANRGAQAQSASPSTEALQAARELTSVMSVPILAELSKNLTSQIWPGVEALLRRHNANISATALTDFRRDFERQQLSTLLDGMNDAASIYARNFTIQEMRALTAFYRTPAGAKALATMPRVSVELMTALEPRIQALQTKITELATKFLQANAPNLDDWSRMTVRLRLGVLSIDASKGWLGVRIVSSDSLVPQLSPQLPAGAYILDADPAGPASKAGIRRGDVVARIAGQTLLKATHITSVVAGLAPNSEVDIEVWRFGSGYDGLLRSLKNRASKADRNATEALTTLTNSANPTPQGAK